MSWALLQNLTESPEPGKPGYAAAGSRGASLSSALPAFVLWCVPDPDASWGFLPSVS